jgi:hypothetical protein
MSDQLSRAKPNATIYTGDRSPCGCGYDLQFSYCCASFLWKTLLKAFTRYHCGRRLLSCSVDMSGLVEKVKDVVRNRSKQTGIDSTRPRTSSDQYATTPEASISRRSMQDSKRGRASGSHAQNGLEGTTGSFAAMNVSDPHATISASHPPDMSLPPLPGNSTQNIESSRAQTQPLDGQQQGERPINDSKTTSRTPTHARNVSGGEHPNQEISLEIVPDRDSSMRRKPLPSRRDDANAGGLSNMAMDRDKVNRPRGSRTPARHKHARSTDVAPNDPSPLIPQFTTRSPVGDDVITGEKHPRDLRLPANFDLSNTERTHVETSVAPAVTQEDVHIKRTELVTKAIHRDIHIDHHYTYVQPIPILEILPARHFRLDPITGVKTEIPAPPGYKLPTHLEPRRAEDYGHLRQTTRHYVVDEDHPHGKLESSPFQNRSDVSSVERHPTGHQGAATRV